MHVAQAGVEAEKNLTDVHHLLAHGILGLELRVVEQLVVFGDPGGDIGWIVVLTGFWVEDRLVVERLEVIYRDGVGLENGVGLEKWYRLRETKK